MKKILFYTNQFFGQIGGEEFAYTEPFVEEGKRGNANAFAPAIQGGEIVATIVCGDNYFVENMETCKAFIKEQVERFAPDILIAGPAFNAGRFGIACCETCKFVQSTYGIPSITGLYWENPGVEMYKADCYIMEVGKSAATIRKAIPLITGFVNKLIAGEPLGTPKQEHYYPKGQRVNVFHEKNGAERAVDMLVKKLKGEPYETELEFYVYEKVTPTAEGSDIRKNSAVHHGRHRAHGQSRPHVCRYGKVLEEVRPERIVRASQGKIRVGSRWLRPGICQRKPQPGSALQHVEDSGKRGCNRRGISVPADNHRQFHIGGRRYENGPGNGGGPAFCRGVRRYPDKYVRNLYALRCNDSKADRKSGNSGGAHLYGNADFQDSRSCAHFRSPGDSLSDGKSAAARRKRRAAAERNRYGCAGAALEITEAGKGSRRCRRPFPPPFWG